MNSSAGLSISGEWWRCSETGGGWDSARRRGRPGYSSLAKELANRHVIGPSAPRNEHSRRSHANRQAGAQPDMQPVIQAISPLVGLPRHLLCQRADRQFGGRPDWSAGNLLSMPTGKHANRQRGPNADWRANPFGQVRRLDEGRRPICGNSPRKTNIWAGLVQPQA